MKNLTIYEVYVEMQDQAQCDRMKQICVDNRLPIWNDISAFEYLKKYKFNTFCYDIDDDEFYIINPYTEKGWFMNTGQTKVTEQEFIELLKQK